MMSRGVFWAWLGWMAVVPCVWRNCRMFGPVRRGFSTSGRELWLTIDDGPDPRQTPAVLDVLGECGVRATFFVIGRNAREHPGLCRRMVEEGHSVQNHTETHAAGTFWAAMPRRARREILVCSGAVLEATGIRPRQFRAPVGMANPFVHLAAAEAGLPLIGWSASGHDGIAHDPGCVIEKIRRSVRPGGIVLLHDSHLRGMSGGERACTLLELLNTLRADGYSFRNDL